MKQAAGLLVFRGPRVLAFRRFDKDGIALPCGHVHSGEPPDIAALREGNEETGYEFEIIDSKPFVGFDTVGGMLVHTYLAKIVGGELIEMAPGEGQPLWASMMEIATGPYWHYNVRALRHFDRKPPLNGMFHSHLTIQVADEAEAKRAAKLVGGRLTVINLSRGDRAQKDVMITHYFLTGYRGLDDQYDILAKLSSYAHQLEQSGIHVLRVKLEYELLHEKSNRAQVAQALDGNEYTEVHIKCVHQRGFRDQLIGLAAQSGWHPSRNPYDVREDGLFVQFINKRFYEDRLRLADIDASVDAIVPGISELAHIERIAYETAVYDSASAHDRWWMEA